MPKSISISEKFDVCNTFDYLKDFVSPRELKIEHFFFLQLIDNQKIAGGYHIKMIDLGKFKEVTTVLKLNFQKTLSSFFVYPLTCRGTLCSILED